MLKESKFSFFYPQSISFVANEYSFMFIDFGWLDILPVWNQGPSETRLLVSYKCAVLFEIGASRQEH